MVLKTFILLCTFSERSLETYYVQMNLPAVLHCYHIVCPLLLFKCIVKGLVIYFWMGAIIMWADCLLNLHSSPVSQTGLNVLCVWKENVCFVCKDNKYEIKINKELLISYLELKRFNQVCTWIIVYSHAPFSTFVCIFKTLSWAHF